MGMIQRAWTVIKANINALLGRAEDPKKIIEQALLDMHEQLAKTKLRVAAAIADEKKLKSQLDQQRQLAEEWETRALLGLREGREDLATQALLRQAEHTQHAERLSGSWQQHERETALLRDSLRSLAERVEEMRRKKDLLLARHTRVEAQQQIQDTLSSMNDQSAVATFERMEHKIEDMERQASAAVALAGELNGSALEHEFKALEQRGAADLRLLELKQQLGLVANDARPARQLGPGASEDAEAAVVMERKQRG